MAGAAPISAFAALIFSQVHAAEPALAWKTLQPGVEYAVAADSGKPPHPGDASLHIVRIDPAVATLRAEMASARDGRNRTAQAWCRETGLSVAINMGMYLTDYRSNVGYARIPGHVNNARWNTYRSALAFGPSKKAAAPALWVDLDDSASRARVAGYGTVIQNLRLIRSPGRGVWGMQDKRWSEAAVAMDARSRVLFIFTRRPHVMKEFNDRLLALPLGIVAAMHVEGGPQASLSIHAGGVDLDLDGGLATGFRDTGDGARQRPIPNVLGVAAPAGGGG